MHGRSRSANPPHIIEDEANDYTINEIGQPPDFVLEVASHSTGERDYTARRGLYAGYGVREYWRFDHTDGQYHDTALAGDLLVNGVYQPIPVAAGADGIVRATARLWDWSCTGRPGSCVSGTRQRRNTCPT